MAGYTNGFTAINGDIIDAPLFTQEYTSLGAAFNSATGHKHDGTASEGALIPAIADSADLNEVLCDSGSDTVIFSVNDTGAKVAQLAIADGAILPTLTNDVDLGSAILLFKDSYLTTLTLGATTQVDAILDDGTMAANSATALVSQASIVTYVADATLDGGSF